MEEMGILQKWEKLDSDKSSGQQKKCHQTDMLKCIHIWDPPPNKCIIQSHDRLMGHFKEVVEN